MFTGCIKAIGKVLELHVANDQGRLRVATALTPTFELGGSVAINGVCLTATEVNEGSNSVSFDILSETLSRTNLGSLGSGDTVNIEPAVCVGDPMDGHMVTGHIDCTSQVIDRSKNGNDAVIAIAIPDEFSHLLIPKGSIAVDGVSLTIASLEGIQFRVHIIPHTAANTNLGAVDRGTKVNLEFDVIGKYLHRFQQTQKQDQS